MNNCKKGEIINTSLIYNTDSFDFDKECEIKINHVLKSVNFDACKKQSYLLGYKYFCSSKKEFTIRFDYYAGVWKITFHYKQYGGDTIKLINDFAEMIDLFREFLNFVLIDSQNVLIDSQNALKNIENSIKEFGF